MLVQIDNIHKTRWGRNWGSYERIDWVSDADIDTVSLARISTASGTLMQA